VHREQCDGEETTNLVKDCMLHNLIGNKEKEESSSMFLDEAFKMESSLLNCKFGFCMICRQRRLNLQTTNNTCNRCSSSKNGMLFSHENNALPTWIQGSKVMYSVPKELSELSIIEKMLIQRISPLVPVIHIKNGILGSRGHIVSFFQDIKSIATILPNLPSEVQIVKVIRDNVHKNGESSTSAFTVNRRKVINALKWLQKYNPLYKDIKIDESRLSWMGKKNICTYKDVITIRGEEEFDGNNDRYVLIGISILRKIVSINDIFLKSYLFTMLNCTEVLHASKCSRNI